jgi:voltage-gated potassium channel
MLAFEPAQKVSGGFESYGDALWWTSMLVTTMGSQFWPQTAEGRFLCFLLALYGLAVFGYITASLASFFVGRDADRSDEERSELSELRREVAALRRDILQAQKERQI